MGDKPLNDTSRDQKGKGAVDTPKNLHRIFNVGTGFECVASSLHEGFEGLMLGDEKLKRSLIAYHKAYNANERGKLNTGGQGATKQLLTTRQDT